MDHRGVGLLNLQNIDNYGAVLLCLALQKQIEDLGYDVNVIDFRPVNEAENVNLACRVINKIKNRGIKETTAAVIKKIAGRNQISVCISSELKKNRFEEFRRIYLNRTVQYNSAEDIPRFDSYVVGSDVIWKPERVLSDESDVYFLKFTDNFTCNRISYAASIGTIDKEELEKIQGVFSEYIKRFNSISVREPMSIQFVQPMVSTKVFSCADPTLLQARSFYDVLADSVPEESYPKYIYLYMFDDDQDEYDYVNRCSEQLGIPVICQCNAPDKIKNILLYSGDDGPAEFLNRIKNAEYIITNSFHGTIFSLLFHKNFAVLSRKGLDFRAENILGRLGLESRFVNDPKTGGVLEMISTYHEIDKKIDEWRAESVMFLKNALKKLGGV